MNLKSYPNYKDSEISWIGEIPGHWRTNKLKTYFFIVNGSTPKDFEENWGGDICWITPADYKTSDVYINSSSRHITKKGLNSCGTTIVPAGSIIVSNRAPIGTVAIANKELCTNQGCKSLTVKRDINTKFVYYILSINKEELNKLGRGTTFMELSSQDLGTFEIPIATLVEQEHIVKFLDKKTTKIEENIAKNQELIKLLEEKRVALINHVVTKGLNPDVPMKDSGVEWIGEIPTHWEVEKIKNYFYIHNGSTPKDNEEHWGGDICWITPADYKTTDIYINKSSRQITKIGLNSCGTTLVPKGSIIVSNRAPIGTVAIANVDLCTNQGCKSLAIKRNINTKFVYYSFSINEKELNKLGRGTTFMELSSYDLGTFQIPIAPNSEQIDIVKYLDKETLKIDQTLSKIKENINLLEEYKTSLINHVVTGKIDVRGDEI